MKISLVLTLTLHKMIATNSSMRNLLFTALVSVNSFNPVSPPSSLKGCYHNHIPQPLTLLCEQPTAQQLSGILKLYEYYFANY